MENQPQPGRPLNFRQRLSRLIYSFMLYGFLPWMVVYLLLRSRKAPAYRRRWAERFALTLPNTADVIWVHAVSVGETMAAIPFLRLIQRKFPRVRILFTTTTPTGSERVRHAFGDSVTHVYLPYDLPGAMKRFVNHVRPKLLLVMETEIWPNLFHYCGQRRIPIVVANARISDRSFRRYMKLPRLTAATLSHVTAFVAQTQKDAARLIAMGAPSERVRVTGNMKYEITISEETKTAAAQLKRKAGDRKVWIAASTHAGEDEKILEVFAALRQTWRDLLLVIVPRHPERFDSVYGLCRNGGYQVSRRSENNLNQNSDILLGDTMGELLMLYGISDLAFIGGSLIPHGGQNMLEAAAMGKAVVFGPHVENFPDISQQLLESRAAVQVTDTDSLLETVRELLNDDERRQTMGVRGLQVVEKNRGAMKLLVVLVSPTLLSASVSVGP